MVHYIIITTIEVTKQESKEYKPYQNVVYETYLK